ncbi:DNA-protecting protein DprA [Candidatus Gracilibacteria bacterium]|nr:DNA-protecting protein DprA [Candidatus Gracilibacteria bacterium]
MQTSTISQKDYPSKLRNIYNSPPQLHYRGNANLLSKTCIAVVGTRKSTDYGQIMTEKIIEELSILDIAIVSGLASGIDTIAHQAAIKNGIPTIAVLGTGLDNIFPKENLKLSQQVDLLVSEYAPGTPPLKHHFPQRNRIISGLSIATLIVEAPSRSGALITARFALEQGREIYVLPGDVYRPNSQGIIELMQSGAAYPIRDGRDIIAHLQAEPVYMRQVPEERVSLNLSIQEHQVLKAISQFRATSVDSIIKKSELPTQDVLANLSSLEISGLITGQNGNYKRA